MSAEKFDISYPATAQVALLPREEKAALNRLFAGGDLNGPETTESMGDGRFVSRLGSKRVLWRRSSESKPEILSIVDRSFARSG